MPRQGETIKPKRLAVLTIYLYIFVRKLKDEKIDARNANNVSARLRLATLLKVAGSTYGWRREFVLKINYDVEAGRETALASSITWLSHQGSPCLAFWTAEQASGAAALRVSEPAATQAEWPAAPCAHPASVCLTLSVCLGGHGAARCENTSQQRSREGPRFLCLFFSLWRDASRGADVIIVSVDPLQNEACHIFVILVKNPHSL